MGDSGRFLEGYVVVEDPLPVAFDKTSAVFVLDDTVTERGDLETENKVSARGYLDNHARVIEGFVVESLACT